MICETIPSEILCEIFQLLCDEPISLHVLNNSSRFGVFPWAVGQVCKRWRAMFLSYPHLWTSLFLLYRFGDIVDVDRMRRRTLLYLKRSEQLPLNITVHVSDLSGGRIGSFPEATWKLLLSCSERWGRADVALFDEPLLFELLRCKTPILKSLRICGDSGSGLYHPFTAPPRLTELDLFGWGWAFPWSQLTKLKISTYREPAHGKTLETILSQLQNVEELRVGYFHYRDRIDDHDQCSIRLASLRLLAVPIYPPEILTRIEAPLLEHLWVDWRSGCPEGDYSLIFTEELSSFIRRSSCHIRRLTLHDHVCELLPHLMKLLSSVEVLCIKTTVYGHGSFLVKHITRMNDGVYLLNLRELEVTCLRELDNDEKLTTAMSGLLETRSEESRLISMRREDVPLEPTMVQISMSFK
ncbi:hypothetical protein F5887DRAFT_577916 [Amanita rubescens]|nr:hypothetical protein F5887DRAFT_577916 [Amanita rubescens]